MVSQALKDNIEQRLKKKEKILAAYRQGRGARSEKVAEGTEISENASVSMGEDENKIIYNIPLPDLPNIDEDTLKKLIISGLENIELAKYSSTKLARSKQSSYSNIEILKAQQQARKIEDKQHLLWKRLFEMEEGFPAPVTKRKALHGIKPW